jgi:hypothetical protein
LLQQPKFALKEKEVLHIASRSTNIKLSCEQLQPPYIICTTVALTLQSLSVDGRNESVYPLFHAMRPFPEAC